MNNKQLKGNKYYDSPQVRTQMIVPESVLCSSVTDEITGNTGAIWWTGDDAEW